MSNKQPDYAGLVTLLPKLHQLVDAAGAVILETDEAERIRLLGFQARPGTWRVPPLPADLVAGNPLLKHLAETTDSFWVPPGQAMEIVEHLEPPEFLCGTEPETSAGLAESLEITNPNDLSRNSEAIVAAINRAGGTIERRKLQKKLWRIGAEVFNAAVQRLISEGLIRVEGNRLVRRSAGGS